MQTLISLQKVIGITGKFRSTTPLRVTLGSVQTYLDIAPRPDHPIRFYLFVCLRTCPQHEHMNIAGDHIRSVAKDKVNDTLPSSLVHRPSSFTTKDWSDALLLVNPCCFPLTLFFFNLFRNVSLSCKIDLKAHSFFFPFIVSIQHSQQQTNGGGQQVLRTEEQKSGTI